MFCSGVFDHLGLNRLSNFIAPTYLCVCVGGDGCGCACGGQTPALWRQLSPSTLWVSGFEAVISVGSKYFCQPTHLASAKQMF